MQMHMLPLFLSGNMMHLFNNFFIIMTFYLLFLIPIFYKYIQEEKELKLDFNQNSKLEAEMSSIIKEKEKIDKKTAFIFDLFCFLMLYCSQAPITEIWLSIIFSSELQVLLITILSIALFMLKPWI